MIVLLGTWIFFSARDTTSTDTLQGAIKTSIYASRDDSARVARNTFVINKDQFRKKLAASTIKEFNGKKVSIDDFQISYIPAGSNSYKDVNKTPAKYIPVKAIKVKVDLNTGDATKGKNTITTNGKSESIDGGDSYHNDTHVATYVIQTSDKTTADDITSDTVEQLD